MARVLAQCKRDTFLRIEADFAFISKLPQHDYANIRGI